ncbi:MAG: DUF4864 domain-containing protein [Hyphomicrobiales bacterium]|nr:DUF4864 domain-containing protein [Hyphomicrobiales bacterium]
MRTAIGTFAISRLRISALAIVIALGVVAISPALALPDQVDRTVTSLTAIGAADMPDTAKVEFRAGVVDHVFGISLSDRLEIKAAVETFVWGLSNRQSSAVWLIAPEVEQTKFGSEEAIYGFFSRVHPPLAHAKSIAFDSISTSNNLPIVNIYVTDTAGLQWQASFALARDPAGNWKIVSCRLLPAPGDLV